MRYKEVSYHSKSTVIIFLLFVVGGTGTVYSAPQIDVLSPSSDVWTTSNDVQFEVNVSDSLPAYAFINWKDSLVGCWRAEGNAKDSSQYGNDGVFKRGYYEQDVVTATGKFGQAFYVERYADGGSQRHTSVELGDCSEFDFGLHDSFTIAAWFNLSELGGMWSKGSRFCLSWHSSGRWQFILGHSTSFVSVYWVEADPLNKWVHITITYDSVNHTLRIFVNGVGGMSSNTSNIANFWNAYPFKIGGSWYTTGPAMTGLIDEFLIFNRVLGETEVMALYDCTNLKTTFFGLDEMAARAYEIVAVNAQGNETKTSGTITVDTINSNPVVTLTSPLTPIRTNVRTRKFCITARNTNRDTTLASATLFWDYEGEFRAADTRALTGDSQEIVFTKEGLTDAAINWNCYVVDSGGNGAFAKDNHTLIVGQSNFYVSPGGDDNNPGTLDRPFKTIQKFADIALPGDTCFIRAGTYRETVTPVNSGHATASITYRAYPGERPVISGADVLEGNWTQHDGPIYKTTMNWDLGKGNHQIFINGQAMIEARWPDSDDIMRPKWSLMQTGSTAEKVGDQWIATIVDNTNLTQPHGYWVGAIMHGAWSYAASTGIVTAYSPGTLTVALHTPARHVYNMASGKGSPYYLIRAYNALDSKGEWFYDANTSMLYLYPPDGISLSDALIEARSTRNYAFNLEGSSYINILGIDVFASTINTDEESSQINIDKMSAKYVTHFWILDGSAGHTGVVIRGKNITLQNSSIDYSAANGITLIGKNNTVQNCEISNVNYTVGCYSSIGNGANKSQDNYILNNKIYASGRMLMTISNTQRWTILHNEFSDNLAGGEVWDNGAIYCIDTDGMGTEIAYNHIKSFRCIGVYFDWGCSNFNVHHNVISNPMGTWRYNASRTGIHMNVPVIGISVHHNTLTHSARISINTKFVPSIATGTNIKNNVASRLKVINSDNGDPLHPDLVVENNINTDLNLGTSSASVWHAKDPRTIYLDYDNYDFRLRAGTVETPNPAVDAGQELGYLNDILGHPVIEKPDIGAYEYVEDSVSVLETVLSENWDLFVEFPQEDGVGNPLTYSYLPGVSGLPQGAAFYSDSGIFAWRPWYDQAGTYESIFQPSLDSVTWEKVTITVEDVLLQNWYALWLATHDEMLIR